MEIIKIAAKILALATIFSVIVSYSSLVSSFKQRLYLLSTCSNLSHYLMDKNYLFLLCNGILGFIVKTSGLIDCVRVDSDTLLQKKAIGEENRRRRNVRESVEEKSVAEEEEEAKSVALKQEEEEEAKSVALDEEEVMSVAQGDEREAQELAIIMVDDDDEDNIEGGYDDDSVLSLEDLNEKCEDFIRRMKEVIRIDSRKSDMLYEIVTFTSKHA